MNEDDTFRKLSRVPFEEVTRLYEEWPGHARDCPVIYGWTYGEYMEIRLERACAAWRLLSND